MRRTPGSAVHKAYYAMHHAARAVLLAGTARKLRRNTARLSVVFCQLAKNEPVGSALLMQAGRDINRVYKERNNADYDVAAVTTYDGAVECLDKARRFLTTCSSHFGFSAP